MGGSLDDLMMPPGNRLEALQGDLRGFHSIRVNAQWRIVFR
jgi:toxin HigB-1